MHFFYLRFSCLFLGMFSLLFLSCTKQEISPSAAHTITQEKAISIFIDNLSLEQQISQLFLVCIEGTAVDPCTGENNSGGENCGHVPAGGYIIFRHNCTDSAEQVISMLGNIRTYYDSQNQIQPYFAIDHEGGPVNRLSYLASPLPSQNTIATYLNVNLAKEIYTYAAMQLSALGIQVNFAPVVEAVTDTNIDFLGLRTYGNSEKTIEYSKIAINAYKNQGVFCVTKHFPGNTATDPHKGLPVLSISLNELNTAYIEPFNIVFENDVFGVLMSHTLVPELDTKHPVCLSQRAVSYLRAYTGFSGLVFSDDLLMGALKESGYEPKDALLRSISAGVQVLMVLQPSYKTFFSDIKDTMKLDPIFTAKVKAAVKANIQAKIKMGLLTYEQGENGNYVVVTTALEKIYDFERQKKAFEDSKAKGDWLYGQYFKR
ncbi:MAG TPA: glycoside hydrolase family 3 N-terminal domain-containing protein [Treponemataceae bacterium]|nr:glycoside hydrolase family 3 N-terminal domain-containing protein [Treponemataceae bacterium]